MSELRPSVFWPPYLFKSDDGDATRPEVTSVPDSIVYATPFSVYTTSASTIRAVNLIRPGSVTHAFDQSQRFVPLSFTQGTNVLFVNPPACALAAPPGDYLLFVVDTATAKPVGTPSIGEWVRLLLVPPPVNDLAVDIIGPTSMTLIWTAPGDDCHGGQAVKYDLRRSIIPLTETNFYSGTPVTTGAPKAPGLPERATAGGLQSCLHYYFAIKSRIEFNTWSAISNVADAVKPCGGFGPMAASGGEGTWSPENSVLNPTAGPGAWTDTYRLNAPAAGTEASYGLRLVESAPEATAIDGIGMIAVDHAPGQQAFVRGGNLVLASRQPAFRVATSAGTNIVAQLSGTGAHYVGQPGEALLVRLEQGGSSTSLVLVPAVVRIAAGTAVNSADSVGLLVQVPSGTPGSWTTRQCIRPRVAFDDFVLDSLPADSLRLVFLGRQHLAFVGRLVTAGPADRRVLSAQSAHHSRLGNVLTAVAATDAASAVIAFGDTVEATFPAPPIAIGLVRDRFLIVRGEGVTPPSGALSRRPERGGLPLRFALLQNHPNPFARTTLVRFELPQPAHTTLDIFDVQGRRVRRLTNQHYAAGRWSVDWDRRDAGGRLSDPGVYLYRMQAGSFRAVRKMVVLP